MTTAHASRRHPATRVTLLLATIVVLLTATAAPAWAGFTGAEDPLHPTPPDSCHVSSSVETYLPALRWQEGASGLTQRPQGGLSGVWDSLWNSSGTDASLMWSSTVWGWNVNLAESAVRFCPLQLSGGLIDRAASTLGSVVLTSTIILIVAAAVVVAAVAKRARASGGRAGPIIGFVVSLALLTVMVAQAGHSTGAGATPGDTSAYKPAPLSAGWAVTTVEKTVTQVVGVPVSALQNGVESVTASPESSTQPWSCDAYVATLKTRYNDSWTSNGAAASEASTPWALSYIWQSTALTSWRATQFQGSAYGDQVWCRYLDSFTHFSTSGPTPAVIMGGTPGAFAFQSFNRDDYNRRSAFLVLWANCAPADPVHPHFTGPFHWTDPGLNPTGAPSDATATCTSFFTDPAWTGWDKYTPPKPSKIADQAAGHQDAEDFLRAIIHENSFMGDYGSAMLVMLVALVCLGAFGMLSGALFVCKLWMLFMAIMLIVEILVGMVKNEPVAALRRWLFRLVGVSVYVAFAALVFSMVALFSTVVISLSGLIPGATGLPVILSGASPVLAVWMITKLFKRMGLPTPFSLDGARTYARAAESIGGTVDPRSTAMGAGLMDRVGRRAQSGGHRITRAAGRTLRDYAVGRGVGDATKKRTAKGAQDTSASTSRRRPGVAPVPPPGVAPVPPPGVAPVPPPGDAHTPGGDHDETTDATKPGGPTPVPPRPGDAPDAGDDEARADDHESTPTPDIDADEHPDIDAGAPPNHDDGAFLTDMPTGTTTDVDMDMPMGVGTSETPSITREDAAPDIEPDETGSPDDPTRPTADELTALDHDGNPVAPRTRGTDWTDRTSQEARDFFDDQRATEKARRQEATARDLRQKALDTVTRTRRHLAATPTRALVRDGVRAAAVTGALFTPLAPVVAAGTVVGAGATAATTVWRNHQTRIAAWDAEVERRQRLAADKQEHARLMELRRHEGEAYEQGRQQARRRDGQPGDRTGPEPRRRPSTDDQAQETYDTSED